MKQKSRFFRFVLFSFQKGSALSFVCEKKARTIRTSREKKIKGKREGGQLQRFFFFHFTQRNRLTLFGRNLRAGTLEIFLFRLVTTNLAYGNERSLLSRWKRGGGGGGNRTPEKFREMHGDCGRLKGLFFLFRGRKWWVCLTSTCGGLVVSLMSVSMEVQRQRKLSF